MAKEQFAVEAVEEVGRAKWGIVVSHQHAERKACANLRAQGFEVYLPMVISEQRPTRTKPKPGLVVRPLFSTYVFARIDPTVSGWRSIFSTIGVKSVFMAGERPLVVPDKVVDAIQQREENGFIKIADVDPGELRWQRGDAVRVRGETADYDAIFIERIDRNRVSVLVKLLQRDVRASVHLLTVM